MNTRKVIISILLILLGAFLFVFGEYDDSPGGQLIGLILAIIGAVSLIRVKRKNKM